MSNNQNFGRVLISSIYKRDTRVSVETEAEYMEQFELKNKNHGGLCEIVGLDEYQVKLYFDVDGKIDFTDDIIDNINNNKLWFSNSSYDSGIK